MTRAGRLLLVVAAPKEAAAILRGVGAVDVPTSIDWRGRSIGARLDLVVTGVGKANAAAGTALALDTSRHVGVVSIGVSGALPGSGLAVGDVVEADRCMYGDEGSANPGGFLTIAEMGFGPLSDLCGGGNGMDGMSLVASAVPWSERTGLRPLRVRRGGLATVSTCSGNDALAHEVERRTGALAEDMESAAVGFTAARVAPGVAFCAVRAISNTTGDRLEQTWDLALALDRLALVASRLS
ncbi:MAG: futalosine hydrolase [Phycisphaerae bacterium]|nr:futalosine hydrolase [Phycisphaerae bacterium]